MKNVEKSTGAKPNVQTPKAPRTNVRKERREASPLENFKGVGYELYFTYDDVRQVAKIDATAMTTNSVDAAKYVEQNCDQYFLSINTWLFYLQELSDTVMRDVGIAIRRKGLIAAIREADNLSGYLISNLGESKVMPKLTTSSILEISSHIGTSIFNSLLYCADLPLAAVLQGLRYLKRFTPYNATALADLSIDRCIAVNSRCKDIGRGRWEYVRFNCKYPDYIRTLTRTGTWSYNRVKPHAADHLIVNVAAEIARILGKPSKFCKRFRRLSRRIVLPHNATLELSRSKMSAERAIEVLARYQPAFDARHHFPILGGVNEGPDKWPDQAILQAVPKTYKASRVIAKESIPRLVAGHALKDALYERMKKVGIDLTDQEPNRIHAYLGSLGNGYSTADLSSASDSISRSLARRVLPGWLQDLIVENKLIPSQLVAPDGSVRKQYMLASSGNKLTFALESLIFNGIIRACERMYRALTRDAKPLNRGHAYGDDIIVDDRIFTMVCDVLALLGFTVNLEKSYGPGTLYRESCGVEYYDGYPLHGLYWPRRSLRLTRTEPESVAALTSLQQKHYKNIKMRYFLIDCVRALYPSFTSHVPGTICTDLWEAVPVFGEVNAPSTTEAKARYGREVLARESHYVLTPKSSGKEFSPSLNLQMYFYVEYLQEGPMAHDDPVLKLLGFTAPRLTRERAERVPLVWRKTVK